MIATLTTIGSVVSVSIPHKSPMALGNDWTNFERNIPLDRAFPWMPSLGRLLKVAAEVGQITASTNKSESYEIFQLSFPDKRDQIKVLIASCVGDILSNKGMMRASDILPKLEEIFHKVAAPNDIISISRELVREVLPEFKRAVENSSGDSADAKFNALKDLELSGENDLLNVYVRDLRSKVESSGDLRAKATLFAVIAALVGVRDYAEEVDISAQPNESRAGFEMPWEELNSEQKVTRWLRGRDQYDNFPQVSQIGTLMRTFLSSPLGFHYLEQSSDANNLPLDLVALRDLGLILGNLSKVLGCNEKQKSELFEVAQRESTPWDNHFSTYNLHTILLSDSLEEVRKVIREICKRASN